MKTLIKSISFIALYFLIAVSCCTQTKTPDYEETAPAVITANGLLMVKYPDGIPGNIAGNEYKNLLKENYKSLYEILVPYNLKITKAGTNFKVSVYYHSQEVLEDWSCTENRIDCWTYNGECNPDTLKNMCGN